MDSDGCRFYAICSQACSVERYTGPCNVTTPVTTTSPQTPTVTTSAPSPPSGCVSSTYPPLQVCSSCFIMMAEVTLMVV